MIRGDIIESKLKFRPDGSLRLMECVRQLTFIATSQMGGLKTPAVGLQIPFSAVFASQQELSEGAGR